jgi:hypothetical protein
MGGGFFRQGFNYRRRYVCQSRNAISYVVAVRAPDESRDCVQRVIAQRKIFDVAVIAGEYNGSGTQINSR